MSIPFATSPVLVGLPTIRHAFFGRRGGVSTGIYASLNMSESGGDKPAMVASNRAEAVALLGFPATALATVTQIHSSRVVTLNRPLGAGDRPEADAIVTALPGIALGILTADCAPILFADPVAGVIGAAHAGWKGAIDGILANTVAAMVALGAHPSRIVASIGPTISPQNYEVGPEFAESLLARHRDASNRIARPNGGREHFDLPGFVFDQLHDAGVGLVNDLAICTYADPKRYFSHRFATHQQTTTGRQIALIAQL
ncbi:MAG: pgeF [Hyphomicrobiales bacterium]|nr:pgeF [Hyphomicrobiales bacterium]